MRRDAILTLRPAESVSPSARARKQRSGIDESSDRKDRALLVVILFTQKRRKESAEIAK